MHNTFFEKFSAFKNETFLKTAGQTVSFANAFLIILSKAASFHQFGFKKNDRIAILAKNSPEFVYTLLALWRIGAVAVPINHRWPNEQILENLNDLNIKSILYSHNFKTVVDSLPTDILHIEIETTPADNDRPSPEPDYNEEATIIFTSGSTSKPKAALHTFNNHFYSALGSNKNIPVNPGDSWLLSLPLFHVGGIAILFRTVLGGGTIMVPSQEKSLEENIGELGPTHISLVSTQLYRLLENKISRNKLKHILLGGSAFSDALLIKAIDAGLPVYKSYGSTEMSSQIATTEQLSGGNDLNGSGRVLEFREFEIRDNEILVKGKTQFKGYIENNKLNPATDKNGWFHTGDWGYLDSEGNLSVTGRKDNLFISGGENIQPEEIEAALLKIPEIVQTIVVSVVSDEFGFRPAAFVQFTKKKLSSQQIKNQLLNRIAKYKIPDYIFEFPKNTTEALKPNRSDFTKLASKLVRDSLL